MFVRSFIIVSVHNNSIMSIDHNSDKICKDTTSTGRLSFHPVERFHSTNKCFKTSLSPKKIVTNKQYMSLHRRMLRVRKGVEESRSFLVRSKFKPVGFKGSKVTADKFYRKNASFEGGLKDKQLPEI